MGRGTRPKYVNFWKRLARISLCTTLLLSTSSIVAAFNISEPTNRRWNQPSFKVYIMPYSMGTDSSSFATAVEGALPSLNGIPGFAFSTTSSRQRVQELNGDDTTTISFHGLIGGELGQAITSSKTINNTIYWVSSDIILNQYIPWATDPDDVDYTPVLSPPGYSNWSVTGVSRHELIHAIGLDHEDTPPRLSVVNSVYSYGARVAPKLHGDDRNGLRWIYPASGSEYDLSLSGWWYSFFEGRGTPNPAPHPTQITAGDSLTVDYTLENLGTESVTDIDLAFYLSTSDMVNTRSYPLGVVPYTSFPGAKGGNAVTPIESPTVTFVTNCTVFPGTYYVWARIDNGDRYSESDETNNEIVLPYPESPSAVTVLGGQPSAPSGLQVQNHCDRVHLTWQDNSNNETAFVIYRTDRPNTNPLAVLGAGTTSYDDHPAPDILYTYEVKARRGVCESASGASGSGRRINAPSNRPIITLVSTESCAGIFVDWDYNQAYEDHIGFKIYRDADTTTAIYTGPISGAGSYSYLDTGVQPNGNHTYRVRAYNDCPGTGPISGQSTVGRRKAPPPDVATVTALSNSCDGISVSVEWGGSGQLRLELYRDGGTSPIKTFTGGPPYQRSEEHTSELQSLAY